MMVRFDNKALKARKRDSTIGVEGDHDTAMIGISEADAIVSEAKKHQDGDVPVEEAVPASTHNNTIPEDIEPDVNEDSIPQLNPEAVKAAQKDG
jgi:protein phosphatase PTC1